LPVSPRIRADLVFTRLKIAVFIDGCFWHGCPQHYVPSRTNSEYWTKKITGNAHRDGRTNTLLEAAGWEVLRFWSHIPPDVAAELIVEGVRQREAAQDGRIGGNPACVR
jgi:DNA mismatch endonuclease (patch repair protein)